MELQPEGASRCLQLFELISAATVGLAGLTSRAMTLAVGANSCSICSSFGAISTFVWVTPVTLPTPRGKARHSRPFHLGRVAARRGEMNMEISGTRIGELPFDCLF